MERWFGYQKEFNRDFFYIFLENIDEIWNSCVDLYMIGICIRIFDKRIDVLVGLDRCVGFSRVLKFLYVFIIFDFLVIEQDKILKYVYYICK